MACTSLEDLFLPRSLVTLGPNAFPSSIKTLKLNPSLWNDDMLPLNPEATQTISFHGPPDIIRTNLLDAASSIHSLHLGEVGRHQITDFLTD
jgi:hypothetical protein